MKILENKKRTNQSNMNAKTNETLGVTLFSFVVTIIAWFGIAFGLYLFIGPFSESTLVTFLLRPGGVFPVWLILLVAFVVCLIVIRFLVPSFTSKEKRVVASQQGVMAVYRTLMIGFLIMGKNEQDLVGKRRPLISKEIWVKVLLALVIGWFVDLWHGGFVATPTLLGITLWYELSLNYYGVDRKG